MLDAKLLTLGAVVGVLSVAFIAYVFVRRRGTVLIPSKPEQPASVGETPADIVAHLPARFQADDRLAVPPTTAPATPPAIREKPPGPAPWPISRIAVDEPRGPPLEAVPALEPIEPDVRANEPIDDPTSVPPPATTSDAAQPATQPASQPSAPLYRPLQPIASHDTPSRRRQRAERTNGREVSELPLRLQLGFDRNGAVRMLTLVAPRRAGMPEELEIRQPQGDIQLIALSEDRYDPVRIGDRPAILKEGVDWRGGGNSGQWRWRLGGRDLFVLVSGDVGGVYPFGSAARLQLNARHVVLAASELRDDVIGALTAAGCRAIPETAEGTTGVPAGWLLFRDVVPTRTVPMRDEAHILNALCPLSEIQPHFEGGIRLERNVWLAGFPPRIKFTGALGAGFRAMIDGQPASVAADGGYEAPGWDTPGDHLLWFEDRTDTYRLRTITEDWPTWCAHDLENGAMVCGARTRLISDGAAEQVRVLASNPLLLGACPGEVFRVAVRNANQSSTITTFCPFRPVWALPFDPPHADKRAIRICALVDLEPISLNAVKKSDRPSPAAVVTWISAIRQAGGKGLKLDCESDQVKERWERYRRTARQLWRKLR